LRAGQKIDLDLINSLPPHQHNHDSSNLNFPHDLDTTNFHLHGLHVDPTGDADNVLREIDPQRRVDVIVNVPGNHNPGLFWYHPHKHGSAMVQFLSGMSGAIVIEGDLDQVPEIRAVKERLILIQEIGVDDTGNVPEPNPSATLAKDLYAVTQTYFPINGVVNPIIRMRPGEVQRFRMLNASRGRFFELSLTGHMFYGLAIDGITFDKVQPADKYEIPPGGRYEALIKAEAPGTYRLSAPLTGPAGTQPIEQVFATIIVEGEPVSMALPNDLPQPDYILPDTRTATTVDPRTLEFSVQTTGLNAFLLNGGRWQPGCFHQTLQKGSTVEWTLTNTSKDAHPFHIHTNAFQVLEQNGTALPTPVWHDTVGVPPGGSVKARMRLDDFVGGMVLHCHIINHEDLGMMQNVLIVDDRLSPALRIKDPGVNLRDPALANPHAPGYYVSENFSVCK
jgi:FtsP/CotA-like multicopper oxidase with cupredoxin domain